MTKREGGATDGGDTPDAEGDQWRQAAQRHFDPAESTDLTTDVVFAIADALDVEPRDLKSVPLYDVVDAAALQDTFFGNDVHGHSREGTGTVEFTYEGLLVSVGSDGWIQVYAKTETDLR